MFLHQAWLFFCLALQVFQETVAITCLSGFSLDGKTSGDVAQTLTCQADGTYTEHKDCQRVECEAVPDIKHATRNGEGKVVFGDEPEWTCNAGYSTDATASGSKRIASRCQADGSFTEHLECLNIDDCEGNRCGANGACKDHAEPTGKHLDDYDCECDSGFEQKAPKRQQGVVRIHGGGAPHTFLLRHSTSSLFLARCQPG